MKITKHLTTTNSYEESFTITDELISAFKTTLSELDRDCFDEMGLSEFEDELFEFAWKQYHVEGNTTITQYEETDTVLHGEYDGYTINE
jgi:hypothetical protein